MYLVLQCVLLVEAIILLLIEHRTKTHQYENSVETFNNTRIDLLSKIENLLKKKDELVNTNNEMTKQNHQLTEEEKLLSKHLREMGNLELYTKTTQIFIIKKMSYVC